MNERLVHGGRNLQSEKEVVSFFCRSVIYAPGQSASSGIALDNAQPLLINSLILLILVAGFIFYAIHPIMARPRTAHPKKPQVNIALPLYVLKQLRAMAVRERVSLRHLLLTALPSIGVHVDAADMSPDRRSERPVRRHYTSRSG